MTDEVIERARQLVALKVPFLHQGRDLNGIDCVGTLVYAFDYKGALPAYSRDPVKGELERQLETLFGPPVIEYPKELSELQPRDICAIQYKGPIRHVGMIVPHVNIAGAISLIHACSSRDCVTEHIINRAWLRKIEKVWRL
jgi:hypothetical protein